VGLVGNAPIWLIAKADCLSFPAGFQTKRIPQVSAA
jgi:hypothetical protein